MSKYIDRFNNIKRVYTQFKEDSKNSKLRIRDISNKLNVSEAELLSLSTNNGVSFLSINDYNHFFSYLLSNIDKMMLLIRSEYVVHEKIIKPNEYEIINNKIINKNDNSLLIKFNTETFKYTFFEVRKHNKRILKSFQFFNKEGNSIIKIYLKGKNNIEFENLANQYSVKYDYQIQKDYISKNFDNYKNAKPKIKSSFTDSSLPLRQVLNQIAKKSIPVNIIGYGIECIQCHNDKINNIVDYGPWLNVMDKNFNIHILEDKITESKYGLKDGNDIVNFYDFNQNLVLSINGVKNYNQSFRQIFKDYDD